MLVMDQRGHDITRKVVIQNGEGRASLRKHVFYLRGSSENAAANDKEISKDIFFH